MDYPHRRQWQFVEAYHDPAEFFGGVFDELTDGKGTALQHGNTFHAIDGRGGLMASYLVENQTVFSFYPFANSASVWEIAVESHEACHNPFEGRVRGRCGGAKVSLFDTLYFRNQELYASGEPMPFEVSALAYSLDASDGAPRCAWETGAEDEIRFTARVEAVEESPFWDIPMRAYAVHLAAGDDLNLPLTLFVPDTVQPEAIGPGESIDAHAWIFGQTPPRADDAISKAVAEAQAESPGEDGSQN